MEIKNYNEILSDMADNLDDLISPETIERNNANILYLLLKAQAKGLEVMQNTLIETSTPFSPYSCTDDQLKSLEAIVQIPRIEGKMSALRIRIYNPTNSAITLLSGTYSYTGSSSVFSKSVLNDISVPSLSAVVLFFMSDETGSFEEPSKDSITLTSDAEIDNRLRISCYSNSSLLGREDETDTEYRQRIIAFANKQMWTETIKEEIKALPTVIDCAVVFNNSATSTTIGTYTLAPYTTLICVSGETTQEIADIYAKHSIFPTQNAGTSTTEELEYTTECLANPISVYINPFEEYEYNATITLKFQNTTANQDQVKEQIREKLIGTLNDYTRKDEITENDLYTVIQNMNLSNVVVLNVELSVNNSIVSYVVVPKNSIPILSGVSFE